MQKNIARLYQKWKSNISPSLAKKAKLFSDTPKEPQSPSEDEYSLVPILDVHAACGNGHFNDQALVEGGFALPKAMLHDLGIPEGQGRIIEVIFFQFFSIHISSSKLTCINFIRNSSKTLNFM